MATKKVIDMTARSSSNLAYDDFVYLTKEVPLTDEKMQASVMRDYVLSGVKTSANSGLAQTSTPYATSNPDRELSLDVANLTASGGTASVTDYIAIDQGAGIKKLLVGDLPFASSASSVASLIGGTNVNVSAATGNVTVNVDTTMTGLTSVTSTAFAGALTGNVTGDVTGDLTGDVTGDVTGDLTGTASIATALAATLGVTAGGTGLTTVAKGSVLAVNAADTISAVAGVTNGHVLTYDSAADTVGWAAPGHATGTVTSVAISGTDGIDVDSGSPITTSGTITLGLSGIANSALTNSSVSYGGVSLSLGGSDATPAFDLADATNYEGDAVLSTGETGTTKFLRIDGDGTSSWQVPPDVDTTYTAGDGLDLSVGNEFSVDLMANGGLEITTTELSVAVGISQYDVAQFATGVVDDDFLRIDGSAVEGRSASEVKSDIGLGNVENTALSTWAGSTNITTLGTIATGTWEGTTVALDQGGTGMTSIAKGSVLVANAANTLSAASGVTDGHVLTYTSASDTVGWGAVPSSGDPAGTAVAMAIALGG